MKTTEKYIVTRNACKLCTPLGACLAFKGIEKTVPLLHGSQGCATYIRRYMISHFKEPVDIASSSFSEDTAIFGGKQNLFTGLKNVTRQYNPRMIGIATTCLSETIGDDVKHYLKEFQHEKDMFYIPRLVSVSTPSYTGTHADGYFNTVREIVAAIAQGGETQPFINIIPNMVSPADIRYLKNVLADYGLDYVLTPDYSDTVDGATWNDYQHIPEGGTRIHDIIKMGAAQATIEFSSTFDAAKTAGRWLAVNHDVPVHQLDMPIGIQLTDRFFKLLEEVCERPIPVWHKNERGRLLDSYVDAHKYLFGKQAIVYGDQDFLVSMASFLSEIGIIPVLAATGAKTGRLKAKITDVAPDISAKVRVLENADFVDIAEMAASLKPDLLIGSSKAFRIARDLNIPLIRIGFPIHDRFGAARIQHLGYQGTQQLFDRIVNAVIEANQAASDVGYSYM
ncbi:nitrogenase [candidate division KSB1 bacterium]|nr:nitrogenase [candidate division KSB1 bacterium]